MKKYYSQITFLTILLVNFSIYSQTTVNSLAELLPYLDDDNVDIVMTPGTYTITAEDIDNNLYGTDHDVFDYVTMILPFEGSNSTYDFTGVTIQFETEIFQKFGNKEVNEIHVRGTNVVIKNLTMEDLGWTVPSRTALAIALDGTDNRIENVHMTVRGSFPYGYGDIFGKGSGSVIGHNKHAAINVRGERNHLKDCTIIQRAYGHGIFVQGGIDTVVEGCYVEGELRTTDDVLAEAGTGSPADLVNFETVWGYTLPAGWMFSKQEDGIRAYNTGAHWQTGLDVHTSGMRVIDCTVKRMRSGVVIGFANDEKYVENCATIECETQYSVGSGAEIVNSRGDTKYGPLIVDEYDNSSGVTADLTVLDNSGAYGNTMLAYIGGQNHDYTFRNTQPYSNNDNMEILLSGVRTGVRFEPGNTPTYSSSGVDLSNFTAYPVISGNNSSNNSIFSCGPVINSGANNTIFQIPGCKPSSLYYEAEDYNTMSGVLTQSTSDTSGVENVYSIDNGDWMEYEVDVPVAGTYTINYRVASASGGGVVQFQSGGNTIGSTNIPATGGLQSWTTLSSTLSLTAGTQTIRLLATSGGWNINWFELADTNVSVTWVAMTPQYIDLLVGETQQLTSTVYPANATNTNVIYSSDDTSIATVSSSGLVTAVGLGSTTITVTTADGGHIDTSEVAVTWSATNNLALATNGGIATQSSTAYGGPPELAIDGNTNGVYGNGSVTHTDHNDNLKWWQVDFGSDKTLWNVIVYNRTDCCPERLNNFTVSVIDSNGATTFSELYVGHPSPSMIIDVDGVIGKTVRIEKTSDFGMTLAEIEVYGTEVLSVSEETLNSVKIYPNPTNNHVTISNSIGSSIEVYNTLGKLIMKRNIESNSHTIDISNLVSGVYFARINKEGLVTTKKVIKK